MIEIITIIHHLHPATLPISHPALSLLHHPAFSSPRTSHDSTTPPLSRLTPRLLDTTPPAQCPLPTHNPAARHSLTPPPPAFPSPLLRPPILHCIPPLAPPRGFPPASGATLPAAGSCHCTAAPSSSSSRPAGGLPGIRPSTRHKPGTRSVFPSHLPWPQGGLRTDGETLGPRAEPPHSF